MKNIDFGHNTERGHACLRKKAFATSADAEQRGMKVYQCPHCGKFHQAKDRTFIEQRILEKRLNRQTVNLPRPKQPRKRTFGRWRKAELRAHRMGATIAEIQKPAIARDTKHSRKV